MKVLAIITARGGSKRIPKKNIKEFCGKPIISYSIQAALTSKAFDEVMVSTDSKEIADISREYGANVPFMRSDSTSNDYATTADVILEVLDEYEKKGMIFDYFACIYPTAPFVSAEKLAKAKKEIIEKQADALISIVKYSYPPQRAFVLRDGLVKYQFPEYEKSRSQDLESIYHDCGQFYYCSVKEFRTYNSLILPKTIPFIISEEEVQDIDTMSDWTIAESKFNAIRGRV